MLLLTLTTDKIVVKTSVAGEIDVTAAWTDRDQTSGTVGLTGRQLTTITTATTTDVIAVPGATTTRHVENLFIRNVDASKTNTVTVTFNANAVLYELFQVILYPGDVLEYSLDFGFKYLPIDGVAKDSVVGMVLTDDANTELVRIGGATSTELNKIPGMTVKDLQVNKRYSFFGFALSTPGNTAAGGSFGGVITRRGGSLTDFLMDQLYVLTPGVVAATITDGSVTAQHSRTLSNTASSAGFVLSIFNGTFLHSGGYAFSIEAGRESIASTNTSHDIWIGSMVQVWEAVG